MAITPSSRITPRRAAARLCTATIAKMSPSTSSRANMYSRWTDTRSTQGREAASLPRKVPLIAFRIWERLLAACWWLCNQPGWMSSSSTSTGPDRAREPELDVVLPIFTKHGLELLGPPLPARTSEVDTVLSTADYPLSLDCA